MKHIDYARESGLHLCKIWPRYSCHISSAKCGGRPIPSFILLSREYRAHSAKYALRRIMTSSFNLSDVCVCGDENIT